MAKKEESLLPSYIWVMNHVEGARGRKSVDPLTLFLATQKALLFIFILTSRKIPSSCFYFLVFATNVFSSFLFWSLQFPAKTIHQGKRFHCWINRTPQILGTTHMAESRHNKYNFHDRHTHYAQAPPNPRGKFGQHRNGQFHARKREWCPLSASWGSNLHDISTILPQHRKALNICL